jgi:hypothetical protein
MFEIEGVAIIVNKINSEISGSFSKVFLIFWVMVLESIYNKIVKSHEFAGKMYGEPFESDHMNTSLNGI